MTPELEAALSLFTIHTEYDGASVGYPWHVIALDQDQTPVQYGRGATEAEATERCMQALLHVISGTSPDRSALVVYQELNPEIN
jgi:hypothetical protein